MPLEGSEAPPPWWWYLVGDLCFLFGFWLVTRQSYTSYLRFRGVTKWATQACTIPLDNSSTSLLASSEWLWLIIITLSLRLNATRSKVKILILTNDIPFGRVVSLSIFPRLENSLGWWISWHPHGVCLIVGDEGVGTVSGFILCPLGGPGLP